MPIRTWIGFQAQYSDVYLCEGDLYVIPIIIKSQFFYKIYFSCNGAMKLKTASIIVLTTAISMMLASK